MAESKLKRLPRFGSLEELVEFFDAHDLGEYWDEMPETHFEVDLKGHTHLVAIDSEVADTIAKIARSKHTSPDVLVDSWLREKILEQTRMST